MLGTIALLNMLFEFQPQDRQLDAKFASGFQWLSARIAALIPSTSSGRLASHAIARRFRNSIASIMTVLLSI
jgi:hypothetical protein